jgi:hypothetical protein
VQGVRAVAFQPAVPDPVATVSLSTAAEWAEAMDALARERAGRTPDLFPIALGVDHPGAMNEWLTEDALDSVMNEIPRIGQAFMAQGQSPGEAAQNAVASVIATHSQMYLELGLWLAQTGRVKL